MGREQRRYIRLGVRLLTWVTFVSTGKTSRALTRDISSGGICVMMEGVIAFGTTLELELQLPDREASIRFIGEAVWSKNMRGRRRASRIRRRKPVFSLPRSTRKIRR